MRGSEDGGWGWGLHSEQKEQKLGVFSETKSHHSLPG